MKVTPEKNQKIANMTFASVYPHYITKVEKKGRTKAELYQVIEWLTGFDENEVLEFVEKEITFQVFFDKAKINANAHLITGVICGYRIEDIEPEFETYRNVRYLDKLVDELAKGRKMEKILRGT